DLGFQKPTPIQAEAIPFALEGRDLLACAMTGSGKTAAFLLPTIQRLLDSPRKKGPRALIITPTRELAAQVADDLDDLAVHTKIRGAAIYGGVAMNPQVRAFKSGVDVLVATPGRLLDHLQHDYASLADVEILILDEADRMLDMGFLPDIRRVLRMVPKNRQTLFFSATMPPEIAKLSADILQDPELIAVERKSAPATGVRQIVVPVAQADKSHLVLDILGRDEVRSVLCFTRTKHRANRLTLFLEKHGIEAARIHGNRSQAQRQKALDAFRAGEVRILVATDIAARGIDIDDLSHVINFDVPKVPDDYIHRVGRTARTSRTGDALTFVSPDESSELRSIEKALGHAIERAPRFERSGESQEPEVPHRRGPARGPARGQRPKKGRTAPKKAPSRRPRARRSRSARGTI
ncbi:MAG: DEAD/DEAH box helicase, partial [Planctomycetes bacterium]|nr:DEAD/DEAH box helicase [Planctomycetota bacterium]